MPTCHHSTLSFETSSHAARVEYRRPSPQQRAQATSDINGNSRPDQALISCLTSFPAPLVLPADDLSLDPGYPPQSLREWLYEEDRNEVSLGKNVIYVAAPPGVQASVDFVSSWAHPQEGAWKVACPDIQDAIDYLKAFYYGLPARQLSFPKLSFTAWSTEAAKSKVESLTPRFIGLDTSTECIRIRTRSSADGIFKRQLNLDDLLDAAISILPDDAFALLLLVHHDLYENADDIFTCGRAYGGSRVAVISTARYNPVLDHRQNVERVHAWPASHCKAYVETMCTAEASPAKRPKKRPKVQKNTSSGPPSHSRKLNSPSSVLQAAVTAYGTSLSSIPTPSQGPLATLWLGRVCRTASHELGHCFGIDHCVYYACIMQGSASLAEDVRQPPYLCPVDLAKVLRATGADMGKRYTALLGFCEEHGEDAMFAAFATWIRTRMLEVKDEQDGIPQ
jgi:archaemetzincin